jgi:hypothetical protein
MIGMLVLSHAGPHRVDIVALFEGDVCSAAFQGESVPTCNGGTVTSFNGEMRVSGFEDDAGRNS